jgi:hypothetical protein
MYHTVQRAKEKHAKRLQVGGLKQLEQRHGSRPSRRFLLTTLALFIFSLFLAACSNSPAPSSTHIEVQDFGTAASDYAQGIAANSSGVFVAGSTLGSLDGNNLGSLDAFLRKYDSGGKVWGRQFGSRFLDTATRVVLDGAGNSYLLGRTEGALGFQVGYSDVFLRKYNADGTVQWTKQFGTKGFDYGADLALDGNGNIFVLSQESGSNFALRKFSVAGTLLLTKIVNDASKTSFIPIALAVDSLNHVIVLSNWFNSSDGKLVDVRLYKYDSNLNRVWERAYSTANDDLALDITTDNNNIYFTVWVNSFAPGNGARYVKMDATGKVLFRRQLEPSATSNNTLPRSITTDANGNVFIAGDTHGSFTGFSNAGGPDIVVFKYTSAGSRQWLTQFAQDNYGSSQNDYAFGVAVSDAVYVTGYTYGNLLGLPNYDTNDSDAYLAQLDPVTGQILGVDQ